MRINNIYKIVLGFLYPLLVIKEKIKFSLGKNLEELKMFLELRKITSVDCRGKLLEELIFSPQELRMRYFRESQFKKELDSHWKREEEEEEK